MKHKKFLSVLPLCLGLCTCSIFSFTFPVNAATTETSIVLGSDITVDGNAIGADSSAAVYVSTAVETHADVSSSLTGITNTVIHITQNGTYRISGSLSNAQILVDADTAPDTSLILDSVSLSNQTAAALVIADSDYAPASTASATVSITLNGESSITGSHIPKNTESYDNIKYDGAISSDVSLCINGSGTLNVTGDKEGIETKEHLTIDGGDLIINSYDDGINASTDNVSCITINGGSTYVNIADDAEEGDGIDSNGWITINGGCVYAFAHPSSPDGGLVQFAVAGGQRCGVSGRV